MCERETVNVPCECQIHVKLLLLLQLWAKANVFIMGEINDLSASYIAGEREYYLARILRNLVTIKAQAVATLEQQRSVSM